MTQQVFEKKHHWFLVRGLAREAGHWVDFQARLKRAFPQAEIHCLDLVGSGVHRHETVPLSVGKFLDISRADFLKAKKGSEGPAFVLGMSLGGMVVMEWISRFPDDFQGAVMVNSSAKTFSLPWKRMHPKSLYGIFRASLSRTAEEREKRVLLNVARSEKRRAETLPHWIKVHEERPISRTAAIRQILAASQFDPQVPPRHPKTLVLCGLGDEMVHPSCSVALAKAWEGELRNHPWGGHDLGVDDPDWIVEQLKTWNPL
ncbi:MAG: alpha/beta hydrolase [Bdellovibrionales bacterium]|nr:alpha/beta hydrolase [Bdellovibrionales bacterium]